MTATDKRPRCRLVLASASPRRRQILTEAGFPYDAQDPGEVEGAIAAAPTPDALANAKARAKAMAVAARTKPPYPAIVIGVDTLVATGETVVGKPLDRVDAVAMLTRLSGTRHRVVSGLCLWPVLQTGVGLQSVAPKLAAASTYVTMRAMSAEEIAAYVASGEADDKAGAYAVQETGDQFVERMEGSFLNVVGFPLELFRIMLAEALNEWQLSAPER